MKSFKTKLDLNHRQRTLMAQHAEVARQAWNWGLANGKETYQAGGKLPSTIDLHKKLVAQVKSQNPWYYEVSKYSPPQVWGNFNKAFKRVVPVKGTGFPQFRKKNIPDSFYLEGSIKISGDWVKLPRIGWVKSYELLPPVNLKNVTISKRLGDGYISFKIDVENKATPKGRERIGVDLRNHNSGYPERWDHLSQPQNRSPRSEKISQTPNRTNSPSKRR